MKYSTILVAAFAAQAMARAIPDEPQYDPAGDEIRGAPGKVDETYPPKTDDYKPPKTDEYKPKDDSYKPPKKDEYKPKDDSYKPPKKDDKYEAEVKTYNDKYYAPVEKKTYEGKKDYDGKDYKPYGPTPDDYDVKKSCYDKPEWPTNVYADKPCDIKWQPKHGGEWKDEDDTVVYVYSTHDYKKPVYTVCESCGKGDYKGWAPPKDCKPSNADDGYTYRFKFCKKSDESSYTWGEEFPIYNDDYFKGDKKPVEGKCPPPAPPPKDCPPPPKAPEYPVTPAPEKEEEAAPTYPAPEAPAAPAEAAAPAYPAPQAPTSLVSNETSPEALAPYTPSGSGALRASLSVIVGVAALVTFAL